jgi:uncharacterized protein
LRKSDKEINNLLEIEEVIQKAVVCRLGLIDGDEPYIVPMNFGYKDKAVYLHSAAEGRKIDLIKKHNRVCFELETDVEVIKGETVCQWSMKFRSIIGTGSAHLLEGNDAKKRGLEIVTGHYAYGDFKFPEGSLEKTTIIKIDIENMTGKKSRV